MNVISITLNCNINFINPQRDSQSKGRAANDQA
jgi:hypothetical protein